MTEGVALERARGLVRDAGGGELLERLEHLDRIRGQSREAPGAAPPSPAAGTQVDADVLLAGGGLWSLLAPLLAARGLSVVVADRARIGAAHREWNASDAELQALVRAGIVSADDLAHLSVARYRAGLCKFGRGPAREVRGVLDVAVDAGALLARARAKGEALGVQYLDGVSVRTFSSGPEAARVQLVDATTGASGERTLVARVLVDARGAASPFCTADLQCPTVGGVLEGLDIGSGPTQVDPDVGEILVTTEGIEGGRQHVWEAFPGRPGETTVYLFYYARAGAPGSLLALYGRFFETRGRYKTGAARLVRPTFGYIPGWSRLTPPPRAPRGRVVLVGDAAARHSPLTYCGFGAMLRSLEPAAAAIEDLAGRRGDAPACIVDDRSIHGLTGALACVMAARHLQGEELNELLDAAFGSLFEMGEAPFARLLRDEMSAGDFVTFLRKTASRHRAVWGRVGRGLSMAEASRWALRLAGASLGVRR